MDELLQLAETWRKEAQGDYCQKYNKGMAWGLEKCAIELEGYIANRNAFQQSVHPTSGSLRGLLAWFWFWALPALKHLFAPPTRK